MHVTFIDPKGVVYVNDPEIANELYVNLNKFVDKHPKVGRILDPMMGSSVFFDPSNELWRQKR